MSKEIELAWASGFFDGEGCTSVNKCKPKKTAKNQNKIIKGLRMSLTQVELEPLQRFFEAVQIGKIRGPYQYKNNRQPHYQWNASNMDVIKVLDLLWSNLSTNKKKQALKNVEEYSEYLEQFSLRKK